MLQHARRTILLRTLYSAPNISKPRHVAHLLMSIKPKPQIRHYARRPNRPITSFPQYNPPSLRPIYKNRVFWGGIGFLGLLLWSPIPGWILFGGIGYGFYRLFRYLGRVQNEVFTRGGLLSTRGDGLSFLDSIFTRDPNTRELAAQIQEMAIERLSMAIEVDEDGIQKIFPTMLGEASEEFHFTFPTEVTMVNSSTNLFREEMVNVQFELRVRFTVYLATDEGRKGADIVAQASVLDEGVKLISVDVRDVKESRYVRLKGMSEIDVDKGEKIDGSGVGRGEGEGKTIDATRWTSR